MTLAVTEVLGRSEQGRTHPYICRCDDGEVYFVKGRSATRRGLINEWLCGHLAQALDLPIAPFDLAHVPQELMNADLSGWNTGNVTSMAGMFRNAGAFNGRVDTWNTGAVTSMADMFSSAGSFDQSVGGWDTSAVTDMSR